MWIIPLIIVLPIILKMYHDALADDFSDPDVNLNILFKSDLEQ